MTDTCLTWLCWYNFFKISSLSFLKRNHHHMDQPVENTKLINFKKIRIYSIIQSFMSYSELMGFNNSRPSVIFLLSYWRPRQICHSFHSHLWLELLFYPLHSNLHSKANKGYLEGKKKRKKKKRKEFFNLLWLKLLGKLFYFDYI